MTFKSEAVRQAYHLLPTSTQLLTAKTERDYAKLGLAIEIMDVKILPDLEIVIHVTDKLKDLTSLSTD